MAVCARRAAHACSAHACTSPTAQSAPHPQAAAPASARCAPGKRQSAHRAVGCRSATRPRRCQRSRRGRGRRPRCGPESGPGWASQRGGISGPTPARRVGECRAQVREMLPGEAAPKQRLERSRCAASGRQAGQRHPAQAQPALTTGTPHCWLGDASQQKTCPTCPLTC